MARLRSFQTNFSAGSIDPKAQSRLDIEAFQNGVETATNVRLNAQGGASARPGMKLVAELTAGRKYRAESFVFDQDQSYCVLFSDGQADIYDQDGSLVDTVTGAPWLESYLDNIMVDQELDTMIVTYETMKMQKLVRDSASSFSVADFDFETNSDSVPQTVWHKFADSSITLTPSATTGSVTLTASSSYWDPNHVGVHVRLDSKACLITAFTSDTAVTATVLETLGGTGAESDWDEEVFSPVYGYARCCRFYDGRLWFGGSKSLPTTIFGSRSDAPFNFNIGTGLDAEGIHETIRGSQVSDIVALSSHRHLQVFTAEKEIIVPQSEKQAITASNISFKDQTFYGSYPGIQPRELDGRVYFSTKTRASIRAFSFEDLENAYSAESVTFLSGHVVGLPVDLEAQVEATSEQESYLFVVNEDYDLAVFIAVDSQDLSGWVEWTTTGNIKTIANVNRQMFCVVDRTIDGSPATFLEQFDTNYRLDAAEKATSVSATTSWTGFTHLAGETVSVRAGERDLGTVTVNASGELTTPTEETAIEVGLGYAPVIKTLKPEVQLPSGTTVGENRRVVRVVLDLLETLNVTVNGFAVTLWNPGDDITDGLSEFTGRREEYLLGWDSDGRVTISQSENVKFHVTGAMVEVEV